MTNLWDPKAEDLNGECLRMSDEALGIVEGALKMEDTGYRIEDGVRMMEDRLWRIED